jgi:hypothetical protein
MTFEQLVQEVRALMAQDRKLEENYAEVVVGKEKLGNVNSKLESYFGPPFKPEGQAPSPEAAQYSKPYGGIAQNQTMYYHQKEQAYEAAMLWPWGSGAATTVKIFRKR